MNRAIATVANAAPYHLTTSLEACPLECFWVVLLDCNLEVYQNDKCSDLAIPDPWMRLKQFCEDEGAQIVNMAHAHRNPRDPRQINMSPMADGYFYAERLKKLIHPFRVYAEHAIGVGELKDNKLTIVWTADNGQDEIEIKDLTEQHPKHRMHTLICRHEKLNLPT